MIDRGATAIRRNAMSRPCTLAVANEIFFADDRVLDFGCGHGEDVQQLTDQGWDVSGWDPAHRPDGDRSVADVVLCTYVLNVIETPAERLEVLRQLKALSRRATVVSVRTTAERSDMAASDTFRDGWLTSKGTFQTLWSQAEVRTLIETALGTPPVALAPGVFVVFATAADEEAWRERVGDRIRRARVARGPALHRPGVLEAAYDDQRNSYDALWAWVQDHGRLPEHDEVPEEAAAAVEAAGSVGRAGLVLRQVHGTDGVRRAGTLERAYEEHAEAYDVLWAWVQDHGRLPEDDEVPSAADAAVAAAGSVGQAGLVLRYVHEADPVRRAGKRELAYNRNTDAFEALWDFVLLHGRLPDDEELPADAADAVAAAGSVGHAGLVLRQIYGEELVDEAAAARRTELTTRFAISRLRRRPKYTDLPRVVQRDVKNLFGSYKQACAEADKLLMSIGDPAVVKGAARRADIGKVTSDAVYVHIDAVDLLPPELVVLEACARVVAGTVDGTNIVKVHLDKPRVSYLSYPEFDTDPHPALAMSWVADLRNLDLRPRDYTQRENPPVLHRKELFVPDHYPLREKFARLTAQEVRHGLFDEVLTIGTRDGWQARLDEVGWRTAGHRLLRA